MTDITKCMGDNCPNKKECFRFLAKSDSWQSYFAGSPIDGNGKCDHFWAIKDKETLKRLQYENDR